jgi:hypothetical protein
MHKQRPFFRTPRSNRDMVLAQTARGIRITINALATGLQHTG